MKRNETASNLSIQELPSAVALLFERARLLLLPGAQESPGLFVRYLRRKPGRGLVVIYTVDKIRSDGNKRSNDLSRSVSLTLDEKALNGTSIRFSAQQVQQAPLELLPTGVLRIGDLGLSAQAFPSDRKLLALAASCDTAQEGFLFQALQSAAQVQLQDSSCHLVSARAIPVRYKPANRCVIRYHLVIEHPAVSNTLSSRRELTIFGKVYADPKQAHNVHALMQQLYDEQARAGNEPPFLPRPLGIIETLGLTFTEGVPPASVDEQHGAEPVGQSPRTGTRALRPAMERGRGGEITRVILPDAELCSTARILARLHNSTVRPDESALRTGASEAKRVRERAFLIVGRNPLQAEAVQQLAQELSMRLETTDPDIWRPAHGGFKASQLLFHDHHVFVVDFDGFCLADPALDVGYFLAYLRPSGLWYQHPGMRRWFEGAKTVFTAAYQQGMLEYGMTQASIEGILERSRLYEAALLFKIATRRIHRLNSPRPYELATMLNEVAMCLACVYK